MQNLYLMSHLYKICTIVALFIPMHLSSRYYPNIDLTRRTQAGDPGSPLFLTPYIDAGQILQGRFSICCCVK